MLRGTMRRAHVLLALVLIAPGCDALSDLLGKVQAASSSSDEAEAKVPPDPEPEKVEAPPPTAEALPVAAEPPATPWIAFESTEGRFEAAFPSAPKTETSIVPAAGVTVDMITCSTTHDDVTYAVTAAEFPASILALKPTAVLLDGARDGMVARVGGKLQQEYDVEVDGNTARRIVVVNEAPGVEIVVEAVLVLAGTRLHQAIAVRPAAKDATPDIAKFLDSLRPLG